VVPAGFIAFCSRQPWSYRKQTETLRKEYGEKGMKPGEVFVGWLDGSLGLENWHDS